MLPKKNRLTRCEGFSSVYLKGFYAAENGIAIKYLGSDLPVTRIGFSVGKSFSKKAVQRNRARRVLQEICRFYMQSLKNGFDIIIMPKSGQESIEFEKTKDILKKLFTKANLFNKDFSKKTEQTSK